MWCFAKEKIALWKKAALFVSGGAWHGRRNILFVWVSFTRLLMKLHILSALKFKNEEKIYISHSFFRRTNDMLIFGFLISYCSYFFCSVVHGWIKKLIYAKCWRGSPLFNCCLLFIFIGKTFWLNIHRSRWPTFFVWTSGLPWR